MYDIFSFNVFLIAEEAKEGVNPFKIIPPRSDGVVSVYADYKHFNDLFLTGSIPKYGSMIDLFGALPVKNNSTEETSGDFLSIVHYFTMSVTVFNSNSIIGCLRGLFLRFPCVTRHCSPSLCTALMCTLLHCS